MKRSLAVLFMAVTMVGVLGSTAFAARRPPEFLGRAFDAYQGRFMRVVGVVRRPDRTVPVVGDVTVRFVCGDVSMDMEARWWNPYRLVARVPVARNEPPGTVEVHVTLLYGGEQVVLELEADVLERRRPSDEPLCTAGEPTDEDPPSEDPPTEDPPTEDPPTEN
jgi:hypothetical protein